MVRRNRYIIITRDRFKDSLEKLIDRKRRRGYDVSVVTCEHLQDQYQSYNLHSAIRLYVLNQLNECTDRSCLLLVGDRDEVPGYPLVNPRTKKSFDSDFYYSMTTDTTPAPALLTGRISSNDPDNIKEICELLCEYPGDRGRHWLGRVILTGWVPRGPDASEQSLNDDPGWQCVKEIGDFYEIDKQFEDDFRIIDRLRRCIWEIDGRTVDTLIQSIEKGAVIVRYNGHGSVSAWGNIGRNEAFTVNHVKNLNVGGKTPLVLSMCCLTGDVETAESFAEAWQRNLKAIGVLGFDEPALTKCFDNLTIFIFREIVTHRTRRIGEIIKNAIRRQYVQRPDCYDSTTIKMLRYFGDPDTLLPIPRRSRLGGCVVSWSKGRLDYFSRGPTGNLIHLSYDRGWRQWDDKRAEIISQPVAVSWGKGRLDIFARNKQRNLLHMWYHDGCEGSENRRGYLKTDPAVVSWGNGRLDIFALGKNDQLMHLWYDNRWGNWEDLGGRMSMQPAAVSWGKGRLDVFARGKDKHLWHIWYEKGWKGWENLGGSLKSGPAAVSWGKGRLDIFVIGENNHLWHLWYENGWGQWKDLGIQICDMPAVVSWDKGRLDIFVRGGKSHLWHRYYDNDHWGPWADKGGQLVANPVAVSWGKGRLDIFARDPDGHLMHLWYDNKGWSDWEDLTPNRTLRWV